MADNKGYLDMELLRFTTAGSVDDGKSTLIGRLLYDSKSIFEDQLEAVEAASRSRGNEEVNLALLTDGLKAEREQGITIDVAYRYFATPKRKFIIADTPGHIEYTRNMVTGASTANVAIILVDARNGVIEQTVRHSFIASLLGIQHILVAINKMDLVDFSEEVYNKIIADYNKVREELNIQNVEFIPISALRGDNVVEASTNTPWYKGQTLLHWLEDVKISHDSSDEKDIRFPVQYVIRPISTQFPDFRGYAGRVAGGTIKIGDELTVLPSGQKSKVTAITQATTELQEAYAPLSLTLQLADDIDISRGDILVAGKQPTVSNEVKLRVCWFSQDPLQVRNRYTVAQSVSESLGIIKSIDYRVNVNTLEKEQNVSELKMNDIAEITIKTANPLIFDPYQQNHVTGSVIFIDQDTNETVGVGMITGSND
ncbi:MAG: GTP-binding protein [Paludibacteraceae bacterium]|nr:GTP-binding protein [Paludibacteraceae bacterium]